MKLLDNVYNGFVKVLGDIKVFKFPLFLLYDPGSYKVKGEDIRQVINTVQPGDIFVRGYVNYVDGYIIPGFFSHAGLYLGPVNESAKEGLTDEQIKDFRSGEQIVIHSMAEGVFMEDVINFCRCDYMLILRREPGSESDSAKQYTFDKVFSQALKDLGKAYDFKFDFSNFTKLSCTELVYDCYKPIMEEYNIKIREKTVLFMKKRLITPDDFVRSNLDIVWKSASVSDKAIEKIRKS